jgi:hypothetical protein
VEKGGRKKLYAFELDWPGAVIPPPPDTMSGAQPPAPTAQATPGGEAHHKAVNAPAPDKPGEVASASAARGRGNDLDWGDGLD